MARVHLYRWRSYFHHTVTIGAIKSLTPGINTIKYAIDYLRATITTYAANAAEADLTTNGYPVREAWVAFGNSYAAGIGAGKPFNNDKDTCRRRTGGYIAI
ncbi:hypothetical protein QBC36DRAFT_310167 [Triangularia setosa]|uniref:Uncharacterized protein n=1 Tax=Triangularia setosa TaxID=2587417 RepID=A0AAN7A7X1_9PEZI|nr:hypothetical protein QBC36DRAFT_310167 [Podospora setosa]